MNNGENKEFEILHTPGLNGLFKIYGSFTILKRLAFYIALIITIIFSLILFNLNLDNVFLLECIDKAISAGFGILSALLGLSLAGLVLIVSFGNMTLLKALIKSNINEAQKNKSDIGFSSYQTIIAKFTYAVFVQVLTLISLVLIFFIRILEIVLNDLNFVYLINFSIFNFILFTIIYSLVLLAYMVINIFTIAQMNHMVMFKEVINEYLEEVDKEKSPR